MLQRSPPDTVSRQVCNPYYDCGVLGKDWEIQERGVYAALTAYRLGNRRSVVSRNQSVDRTRQRMDMISPRVISDYGISVLSLVRLSGPGSNFDPQLRKNGRLYVCTVYIHLFCRRSSPFGKCFGLSAETTRILFRLMKFVPTVLAFNDKRESVSTRPSLYSDIIREGVAVHYSSATFVTPTRHSKS